MKGFALILMMIGSLLAVQTALAENADVEFLLNGTYEMVANGSCLHSQNGFTHAADGFYYPNAGPVWGATTFAEATWTFSNKGTGTVSGWNYVIDFPPGRPIGNPAVQTPNVRNNPISFTFHYELTASGEISATFDAPFSPPVLPPMYGKVSIDRKVISLWSAYQPQQGGVAICNTGRILFRAKE